MNSFYGGKPGAPFVIKKAFTTVEEMKAAFAQGPAYKEVWYDEYCIISSLNNNSGDSGKVFRRGYDYSSENCGAEFVCRITGPEGGIPWMYMSDIEYVKEIANTDLTVVDENMVPSKVYPKSFEDGEIDYYTEEGAALVEDRPAIQTLQLIPNKGLVSGVDHSSIDYTWCTIKDSDNTFGSRMYFGVQIPYTVIELKGLYVTSEEKPSVVEMDDTKDKPFHYQWQFNIPNPVKELKLQDGLLYADLNGIGMKEIGQVENGIVVYTVLTDDDLQGQTIIEYLNFQDEDENTRIDRNKMVFYNDALYFYDASKDPATWAYLGEFSDGAKYRGKTKNSFSDEITTEQADELSLSTDRYGWMLVKVNQQSASNLLTPDFFNPHRITQP